MPVPLRYPPRANPAQKNSSRSRGSCLYSMPCRKGSSPPDSIMPYLNPFQMKCVGSEDGTKPCQRCKRSNTEYGIISNIPAVTQLFPDAFSRNTAAAASLAPSTFILFISVTLIQP